MTAAVLRFKAVRHGHLAALDIAVYRTVVVSSILQVPYSAVLCVVSPNAGWALARVAWLAVYVETLKPMNARIWVDDDRRRTVLPVLLTVFMPIHVRHSALIIVRMWDGEPSGGL